METIRVVSQYDAALDHKAMGGKEGVARYRRTLDPNLVKALPGKKPVWFRIRELTYAEHIEILSITGIGGQNLPAPQAARAFACVILEIEGSSLASEGTSWRPEHEVERSPGDMVRRVTQTELEAIYRAVGMQRMIDIGGVAIERATLMGNGDGDVG